MLVLDIQKSTIYAYDYGINNYNENIMRWDMLICDPCSHWGNNNL